MIKRLIYGIAILLSIAGMPFMVPIYWVVTGGNWFAIIFKLMDKAGREG